MFWKRKPSPNDEIREVLFGDLPIEKWTVENADIEPWTSFGLVKELLQSNQKDRAVAKLHEIISMNGLESRHYVQAYNFLKQLGYIESEATKLFGVVVEVGVNRKGYDLLAVYGDLTARYFNFTGSGVVWSHPDNSLDIEIKEVLDKGREVMKLIGPWEGERRKPVKNNMVRLNLLTSKGLHFGEANVYTMEQDPIGGGLLKVSTILMQALMDKSKT